MGRYAAGTASGLIYEGPRDLIRGTTQIILHPIQTAAGLGNAISHPLQTYEAISQGVQQGWNTFTGTDGAFTQGELQGRLTFDILTFVAGGEAARGTSATTNSVPRLGGSLDDLARLANETDLGVIQSRYFPVDGSLRLNQIVRSLDNPVSLQGLTISEVESLIPSNWARRPMRTGRGMIYEVPGSRGTDIIQISRGNPKSPDALHQNPYIKIVRRGQTTRVPLSE